MPIRNQNWYDRNESRAWPLSDEATGVSDSGAFLPNQFIADLKLHFPDTAGRRAMISSFTVTKNIVSLVIVAANDVSDSGSQTPIAAISLPKTSTIFPGRQYPVEALYPGAGGWVVFGSASVINDDSSESFSGYFSSPAQSILQPSTVRAYRSLPIPDMATLGNSEVLTGLVRLRGGTDVEIVKECREIPDNPPPTGQPVCDGSDSTLRDVIVVRLRETTVVGGVVANTDPPNLLRRYAGPCAGRPESNNCGDPEPIELLAGVQPDCCGNIDILLKGCASLSKVVERASVDSEGNVVSTEAACGIMIACDLGLADACVTADRLPDATGKLPNEVDDLCESITVSSITLPPEESLSETFVEVSDPGNIDPLLPLCDDMSGASDPYEVRNGSFGYSGIVGDPDRIYFTPDDSAIKDLSIYPTDFDPRYKRVSARVYIGDSFAIRHNAAVVAYYRETSPASGKYSYYIAEIDWDAELNGYKRFRIAYFDGTQFVTFFVAQVNTLTLDRQYDILFTIHGNPKTPTSVWFTAELYDTVSAQTLAQIGPVARANFFEEGSNDEDNVGAFGMHGLRSHIVFDNFCIENSTDDPALGA